MPQAPNLIITLRRRSPNRRFWRELGANLWWIFQKRVYYECNAPFSVLGHQGFRVSKRNGRIVSDEVELVFFGRSLVGDKLSGEILTAIEEAAKANGYSGVYYRVR